METKKTLEDARLILAELRLPHPRYPTIELPHPRHPDHLREMVFEMREILADNNAGLPDIGITEEAFEKHCVDIKRSYVRFCADEILQYIEMLRHRSGGINDMTAAIHDMNLDMRDLWRELDWNHFTKSLFDVLIKKQ